MKKTCSLLLTFLILFAALPIQIEAASIVASGYCGRNNGTDISWALNSDGLLTFSGSGPMEDYTSGASHEPPWKQYKEQIYSVQLENGITHIGDFACYELSHLTGSLILPESTTSIGNWAFGKTALVGTVTIPAAVETIYVNPFGGSGNLTTFEVADGNTHFSADDGILYDKNKTTLICCPQGMYWESNIPDTVTVIASDAFYYCTKLTGGLELPDHLQQISGGAFMGCSGLSGTVLIPESVTLISIDAFSGCDGLSTYVFLGDAPYVQESFPTNSILYYIESKSGWSSPTWNGYDTKFWDGVIIESGNCGAEGDGSNLTWQLSVDGTLIISGAGEMADWDYFTTAPWHHFYNAIIKIVLENGINSIGNYAFYDCDNLQGELDLPNSVYTIGDDAFAYCRGLSGTLLLPDNLETIGKEAFACCDGLSGELVLPDGLTSIGWRAFWSCDSIFGPVHIPKTVSSIGDGAFSGWSGFTKMILDPDNPYFTVEDDVLYDIGKTRIITSIRAKSGPLVIPETVVSIGEDAFSYCDQLTGSLVIPDSVTEIGSGAFFRCHGLSGSLELSKNLATIGSMAFSWIDTFTGSVYIPATVTTIDGYAFNGCENLTEYYFYGNAPAESSTTFPDDSTLYYISGKTGWTTPTWNGYTTATWEGSTTVIASGTCGAEGDNLTWTLDNSGNLTISGTGAMVDYAPPAIEETCETPWLKYADQLQTLTILDGITHIGDFAFHECRLHGTLNLPDSIESIGQSAFCHNDFTGTLVLPESLLVMGPHSFAYCPSFTGSVYIPETVTDILINPFCGDSGLTEFVVDSRNPAYASADGMIYSKDLTILYACPCGKSGNLVLSDTLSDIRAFALSRCSRLTGELLLPDSLSKIGVEAFFSCSGFTGQLVIPDDVIYVGDAAFAYCSGFFGTLNLSANIESMGNCFRGCIGITNIFVDSENQYYASENGILYSKNKTQLICCPAGYSGNIELPDTVQIIGELSFERCANLGKRITIPENVTLIQNLAFSACNELEEIRFLGNAPTIESINSSSAASSGITLYYISGKTGWTTPTWNGYATATWNPGYEPHTPVNDNPIYTPVVEEPAEEEPVAEESEIESPMISEFTTDSTDAGDVITLDGSKLDKITTTEDAVNIVENTIDSMSQEQSASAAGVEKLTRFAEGAVYRIATVAADDSIQVSESSIGTLAETAAGAVKTMTETLENNGVSLNRELNSIVRFQTDNTNIVIDVKPDSLQTMADRVLVESSRYSLTLNLKSMSELLENGTQRFSVREVGTGFGKEPEESAITVQLTVPGGTVTEPVTLSLKPAAGDVTYQSVVMSDGTVVPSKYNAVSGMLEARVRSSGKYTIVENVKDFNDIEQKSSDMQNAIRYLASKGIINGTSATTYNPDSSISRAEIAALVLRALGKLDENAANTFTDVPTGKWYYGAAGSSLRYGIIKGFEDGTFRGETQITKVQITVVAARVLKTEMSYHEPDNVAKLLGVFSDSVAEWASSEVALAVQENLVILRKDGLFHGNDTMTRGDAAILISMLFSRIW